VPGDSDASGDEQDTSPAPTVAVLLYSRGYLGLLLLAALLGIPLSLVAFGFLVVVHELEHVVWATLPDALGLADVPAWWPILTLGVAGVVVGLAVQHLPGHGGHVPAMGIGGGPTPPSAVPGTVVAAGASLILGAVVGPEAPLIAIGSGLALLSVRMIRSPAVSDSTAIISAMGSAAAISAIFGSPLIAAVLLLEVAGLARRTAVLVVLPCLVSSGVGALVFTGLGSWTGFEIGALSIPDLEPVRLMPADVLWTLPLAAVVAVATFGVFRLGLATADRAEARVVPVTVVAGLMAGASAAVYAVATGRSPAEVALSGQATLGTLASDPGAWSTGSLVVLLLCKSVAYAMCLGVFRGGPAFPAIFIGAVFGVLAAAVLPGIGVVPGLAIGMAAGVAVIGLPITSVVLVALLLGDAATSQVPVVILGVVVAMVGHELLVHSTTARPTTSDV
jgi:H+/Cl- antiporter ClcA